MKTFGMVSYINALPFALPLSRLKQKEQTRWVFAPPATLNEMLSQEKLQGALTSSVEQEENAYAMLPKFGIAAKNKILSVNLYSKTRPQNLAGKRVGLTPESSTSHALIKILFHYFWRVEPIYEPLADYNQCEAFLLIGDKALKNQEIEGYQTFDLAALWYEMTQLPFVFALFSLKQSIDSEWLLPLMEQAILWSQNNRTLVVKEAASRCGLKLPLLNHYFSALCYRLGEEEMKGLATFQTLRKEYVSKIRT